MIKSDILTQELSSIKLQQEAINSKYFHDRKTNPNLQTPEELRVLWRKERELNDEIKKELRREIEVGNGVTLHLYSDSHAHTVIKKTAKTIVIPRDKAIKDPSFIPQWVQGGFSAICTNDHEQKWTFEPDPNGLTQRCYWSELLGCYTTGGDQSILITNGRHEHYDYNF